MEAKESLQKFLDSEHKDRFKVTDESSANWALRKIAQHQKQMEQNNLVAEEEIYKIETWNKQVNNEAQQSIDYFQSLLAEYAAEKRKENPKMKTIKLPSGKLTFRKQQPRWNFDDEKAALKSLKENDAADLIKVTEKPKLAEIKKAFIVKEGKVVNPDTGQIVEGITVENQPDKFGVVTDG
ncbi:MAG TPA: host-nuclease inhibitor Gam family protein [Bacteroidales bacterium]|nr:host-nuclease inhibitor Gam family protein [Bacteroidales bacterium]